MISTNALTSFSTRQKTGLNFCLLLQRALRAISTACPCPDGFPLPPHTPASHPQPVHPIPLLYPDHNRQILQHLLPREISTESFTHLLFLLCPLSSSLFPYALCSPSSSLYPSFSPQLFFCCCRYRARVEKVESPAKVHVFYIDYGNVSNFVAINLIVCVGRESGLIKAKC